MRRVAFLSFDWDYEITYEYYRGLQDHLKEYEGVQVVIFSAFGYYYASHRPQENLLSVFSLCDPTDYDGFLIQGNRTWPPEQRQRFVDTAVALGKPVVSINYELAGAHAVGTDNYREEYELVRRVLTDTGRRRPAFVNGLRTSVEAQSRVRGFQDACAELGIDDARLYNANWQMEAGVATAKKMLRRRDDLPDVVFCCNDDLAVGVMETLQGAGICIPDDVMVTGFDDREIGHRTSPHVTTIDRDYRTIAGTALDAVVRLINQETLPDQVFSPARHVLTASCGYAAESDAKSMAERLALDESLKHFYGVLSDIQSSILGADSLYAILEGCERFARDMDCANLFLSLNDDYIRSRTLNPVDAYGPMSSVVARRGRALPLQCDFDHVYVSYESKRILPEIVAFDQPLYVVLPLRHNDACIGTVVTEGVSSTMRHGFLSFYLTMLSASIEAARKSKLLEEALEEAEE